MLCRWRMYPSGSMYKENKTVPRTDPWGTPNFNNECDPYLDGTPSVCEIRTLLCQGFVSQAALTSNKNTYTTINILD